MAHDVFISYSSKDKVYADALCATLEKYNVRCWVAPRDILPGSDYGSAIIEGIKASKVMILIFSSNSNESAHVKREVERAVNHGIIIVPFKIEDVSLSSTLEYFVSGTHWLDAIDPPFENHLKSVTEYVCVLLKKPNPIWDVITDQTNNVKPAHNTFNKTAEIEPIEDTNNQKSCEKPLPNDLPKKENLKPNKKSVNKRLRVLLTIFFFLIGVYIFQWSFGFQQNRRELTENKSVTKNKSSSIHYN